MDKDIIIEKFVQNFIIKEKKHRALFELQSPKKRGLFIDKLNHNTEGVFKVKLLQNIKNSSNPIYIKTALKLKKDELCYVISHNNTLYNQIINYDYAINKLFGNGFGYCIMNLSANNIYV